jgi:ribonuclease III
LCKRKNLVKKILMFLNAPYPADIRVKKESDALLKAGFEIHLLCLRKKNQAYSEQFEGIHLHRIDAGKNNYQLAFWDVIMSIQFVHPLFKKAAVADYLFKKYPFKDEGFLTEIRSRIVNRESLNNLARKVGVSSIVQFDRKNTQLQQVILGNTLEALVGAIYLDKGYLRTKKFVIDKLIQPYFDLEVVVNSNSNHKSKVIEWSQRSGKEIRFEVEEIRKGRNKEFSAQVFIDEQPYGQGFGYTKKKAEQDAAEKTCVLLSI